jgi:hypothetical protein
VAVPLNEILKRVINIRYVIVDVLFVNNFLQKILLNLINTLINFTFICFCDMMLCHNKSFSISEGIYYIFL